MAIRCGFFYSCRRLLSRLLHDEAAVHCSRVNVTPEEISAGCSWCPESISKCSGTVDRLPLEYRWQRCAGIIINREGVGKCILIVKIDCHIGASRHADGRFIKCHILGNEVNRHGSAS